MHFLVGAYEGRGDKNPNVTIIVAIYPLSFYGASAVNIYNGGTINVYPSPHAHWWCSLVCPAAIGYDGDHT